MVQACYRGRVARIFFNKMKKAIVIMQECEALYLSNPNHIPYKVWLGDARLWGGRSVCSRSWAASRGAGGGGTGWVLAVRSCARRKTLLLLTHVLAAAAPPLRVAPACPAPPSLTPHPSPLTPPSPPSRALTASVFPPAVVCLPAQMNYTLYLHAIVHDYARARPLYISLMEYMSARGPDNTVVLFAFALFLACTLEEDWGIIESLLDRGRTADNGKHKFDIAEHGFFRQAVIERPRDAHALLNWALVLQFLRGDYKEAEQFYLRALDAEPSVRRPDSGPPFPACIFLVFYLRAPAVVWPSTFAHTHPCCLPVVFCFSRWLLVVPTLVYVVMAHAL